MAQDTNGDDLSDLLSQQELVFGQLAGELVPVVNLWQEISGNQRDIIQMSPP